MQEGAGLLPLNKVLDHEGSLTRDLIGEKKGSTGENGPFSPESLSYPYLLFSEFRAHLSPEVTNRLLATGLAYGEPRYIDAIILFSDIRSFTERSAGMVPQEIASQLGSYLDAVVSLIHRHEGLVDKFVGDAVMAIWGFASSEEDPVTQALTCAQEMLHLAQSMTFGGVPVAIGIGLNAGQVFIGNIGGAGKRQFTVLGSPVSYHVP